MTSGGSAGTGGPGAPGVPAPDGRAPRWGLGDAALGFVVALVATTLLVGLVIAVDPEADTSGFAVAIVGFVGMWAGLLGVPLWATRRKGSGSLRADFGLVVRPGDVVFAVLGAVLQYAVALLYLPFVWLHWLDLDKLGEPARDLADRAGSVGTGFFVLALAAVAGAPVIEELFFRGLVLRSAARRWGPAAGIVVSALVFGLAHFQALQLPALVLVGAACAGLATRTGRLGPSIFVHLGFNAVAMVQLAVELGRR